MLNKKFLTRLLDDNYRQQIMSSNCKFISSDKLKLKQYATYVVDKFTNDRDNAYVDVKEANYGYSPIEVLAYVSTDGSIKTAFFEFNSVSHFLKKKDHTRAVEVVTCILSELVKENKKDVNCFDIDKIEAYLKKIEKEYASMQEQLKKLKEEQEKQNSIDTPNIESQSVNQIEDGKTN